MRKSLTVTNDNKYHWFQVRVHREQIERLQRQLAQATEEIERLDALLSGEESAITVEHEAQQQAHEDEIKLLAAERDKAQADLREVGLQLLSMAREMHEMTTERDTFIEQKVAQQTQRWESRAKEAEQALSRLKLSYQGMESRLAHFEKTQLAPVAAPIAAQAVLLDETEPVVKSKVRKSRTKVAIEAGSEAQA